MTKHRMRPACGTYGHQGRRADYVVIQQGFGAFYKCRECAERMQQKGWQASLLNGNPRSDA